LILRQAVRDDWVPGDALRGGPGGAEAERERRRRHWPPVIAGAVLIVGAALVFLHEAGLFNASRRQVTEMVVVVVALSLVVGPSLLRLARSLANERSQRIRSQERADVAAHLHDSVLQTLALIQRRAEDPREVSRLARSQERELRHWLFEPGTQLVAETLATALRRVAEDVEATHGVRIEVVTVGDCALDERLKAMAAAAREGLTNAAKFAGEGQIDLYAEVDDSRVQIFVRDHGLGFDPLAIPRDRCGVRQSIIERMDRHGGRAVIDAQPGRGTEIELVMEQP
jgi:signal transduction histidine kinase